MTRTELSAEAFGKITEGRGSIELRAEDFAVVLSGLRIKEALENKVRETEREVAKLDALFDQFAAGGQVESMRMIDRSISVAERRGNEARYWLEFGRG